MAGRDFFAIDYGNDYGTISTKKRPKKSEKKWRENSRGILGKKLKKMLQKNGVPTRLLHLAGERCVRPFRGRMDVHLSQTRAECPYRAVCRYNVFRHAARKKTPYRAVHGLKHNH